MGLYAGGDKVSRYTDKVAKLQFTDDDSKDDFQKAHLNTLLQSSEWNFCKDSNNPWVEVLSSTSIQLQYMHDRINYHLTNITNYIRSSEVNIWVMCLLNKYGFLVDHPLFNPITGKDRTKAQVSQRMGCGILSRLIQSGIVRYNLSDSDMDASSLGNRQAFLQSLGHKETKGFIPPREQLQILLEDSIKSLEDNEFTLFQHCIADMLALQDFRQPLDVHERRKKSTKETTMLEVEEAENVQNRPDQTLDYIAQHFGNQTPSNRPSKK